MNQSEVERKVYYKVCRLEMDGSINSLGLSSSSNPTKYQLNKFTYSPVPGTFLFVFDTLDNVKKFVSSCGKIPDFIIYECEVEGICEHPTFAINYTPPIGTVFAYGVKLTKKIEEDKKALYTVCLNDGSLTIVEETFPNSFGCNNKQIIDGTITYINTYYLNKITHLNCDYYVTLDKEFAEFLSKTIKKGLS